MKVLFVCRGNVGRSQMAEAILRKEGKSRFDASSAGTMLSGPEQPIGELVGTGTVCTVMNEIGVEVSKYVRKQITPAMAESADMIILTVDEHDPIPDYLLNNPKVIRWNIPDPKGQTLEFTRAVRDQIAAKIANFLAE